MRKHSKKYIKDLFDKLSTLQKEDIVLYRNYLFADMEPFCYLYIMTKFNLTIISDDRTKRGSETHYFKTFEEFLNIFRKEYNYRIPIFQLIKEIDKKRFEKMFKLNGRVYDKDTKKYYQPYKFVRSLYGDCEQDYFICVDEDVDLRSADNLNNDGVSTIDFYMIYNYYYYEKEITNE